MKKFLNVIKIIFFPLILSCLIGMMLAGILGYLLGDEVNSFVSLVNKESIIRNETELEINNQVIPAPVSGDLLGTLLIEKLGYSEQIAYGTGVNELVNYIGFYSNSKLPGLGSNTVLMGHRAKLSKLANLIIGDKIIVDMLYGNYEYQIKELLVVEKSDRDHFKKTDKEQLTIVIDYPFDEWGSATQSFVILCDLVKVN